MSQCLILLTTILPVAQPAGRPFSDHGMERVMKVLMVLTSHDHLGNGGAQNWILAGGIGGALLCLQRCRRPDHARITQGRAPAARSEKQRAELPESEITRRFEKDADAEAQLGQNRAPR